MALSTFWYIPFALFRRFDAVWCVKPYPSLWPACWLQKLRGAKIVFDIDDLDWAYSHGLFRILHRLLQTPWPRLGSFATYHNPKLKEALVADFHLDPSRLVRVPQGVDPKIFHHGKKDFSNLPAVAQALKDFHPLLVFTAHLNVACDLGELLESFRLFLARHPQSALLVAGGGPDQVRFEQEAARLGLADRVRFTGLIPSSTVASCLRAADAVLVYYRDTEANRHRASLKVREALSCGCRVVATRVGDYKEWAAWATLSDPRPDAFASAVEKSLRRRKARRKTPDAWHWVSCVADLERSLQAA